MMKQKPDKQQLSYALFTNIKEIEAHRNYWLIMGETKKWVAKPIRDQKHSQWWEQVEQEITDRGFAALPRSQQVGNWLLSEYIEGRMCDYKVQADVGKIVETLALFHQFGKQLDTPPIHEAAYLLSDRLYERIKGFYHYLVYPTVGCHSLAGIFDRYGSYFYQQGYDAYNMLNKQGLVHLASQACLSHMLTHRDLASHNWMKDNLGKIWLIDFETADYDLQVGDLWQICSRILSEHKWDVSLFIEIMEKYQAIHPLCKWEKQILGVLCSFPNEFFRESIGLIEQKRGYKLEQTLPYLERIVMEYPIWVQNVEQIKKWLG